MEIKELSKEQIDLLNKPLPKEAITPHPTKKFLSTIKSIYVTERLNEVFGVGKWTFKSEIIDGTSKMVIVKVDFSIPSYGIQYECYGGNDNSDRGDAFKGAVTDALTKIGSWLGIGGHVWKGNPYEAEQSTPKKESPVRSTPTAKKRLTFAFFEYVDNAQKFFEWLDAQIQEKAVGAEYILKQYYDVDAGDIKSIEDYFNLWREKGKKLQ